MLAKGNELWKLADCLQDVRLQRILTLLFSYSIFRIRTKFSIIDPVEEEYKARLASKKNRYNFLHNNSNNNTDNNLQNLATFHKPTVYKRMVESQATVDRDADQVTPLPPPLVSNS